MLALFLGSVSALAYAEPLLFLTNSTSSSRGKFVALDKIAQSHGVDTEVMYFNDLPKELDAALFKKYSVIWVDSFIPGPGRKQLDQAFEKAGVPVGFVSTEGKPRGIHMPEDILQRLNLYYANGGQENFNGFFATVAAWRAGKPWNKIAAPKVFPKSGFYHPDAPNKFFANAADYSRWQKSADKKKKTAVDKKRPTRIGIAFYDQNVGSMQAGLLDGLIRGVEQAGGVPMAFYYPFMNGDEDVLSSLLTDKDGKPVVDVIISTRVMPQPDGAKKSFEKLGIPVTQAIPYTGGGDEKAWREDQQGIPMTNIPFYLALPEFAGVTDIQVAAAVDAETGNLTPIKPQLNSVVAKAMNLAKLQQLKNADKHVTVFFWNYPGGEKSLGASFLNVPESLVSMMAAMQKAGYDVQVPEQDAMLAQVQALLAPYYRDGKLQGLLDDGLAEKFPVKTYKDWLQTLPEPVQKKINDQWGDPEKSSMVVHADGQAWFVMPRVLLGKVAILPQAPRGEKIDGQEAARYHSVDAAPSHFYLAEYLWARTQHPSDAIIHLGTHGTQEWLPGKERGLAVDQDYPFLLLGDVPIIYPYIIDNIGEAVHARRRGRAVIISHQTPPFRPAGLHTKVTETHNLLHDWFGQMEGRVKEQIEKDLIATVTAENIEKDMGWRKEDIAPNFAKFADELHVHLHDLATMAQPLGLHAMGRAPKEFHRVSTVLMMLGEEFWHAAGGLQEDLQHDHDHAHDHAKGDDDHPGKVNDILLIDYEKLEDSAPYRLLRDALVEGKTPKKASPALQEQLAQARQWYENIGAQFELPNLLAALDGRYIETSYGGDPIRNPDGYPTGRNMYGFDPTRIPTEQAWKAGKQAADELLAEHQSQAGKFPQKLAFSLWSTETMRQQGVLEAQALWLMGVEPVWGQGGRIVDVRLIDRKTLGRPRVDVVLSVTGLYRDHFPNTMKHLARAVQLASGAVDEKDNAVAANTQRIQAQFKRDGVEDKAAQDAAQTRIFTSASGTYGTGLTGAAMATDSWDSIEEGDQKLADLYLGTMQYAYGPDESTWGQPGVAGAKDVNLYAQHLSGTEGAVLARSSNLYGVLTTDHPFEFLGGIGLAVRRLDGKMPELYISDLRKGGAGRIEGTAKFLSKELATRQFHPGYIKAIMAEGYSGTLEVVNVTNNLWGWNAVAREMVRDDQWETMVDVYVRDKFDLGLQEWFEKENPHALAQAMERMLEAARKGYWDAKPETVELLKERYREMATQFDVRSDNKRFLQYVADGLPAEAEFAQHVAEQLQPPEAAPPAEQAPSEPAQDVEGMKLEKQENEVGQVLVDYSPWIIFAALLLVLGVGAARQAKRQRMPLFRR
ncbi:cobaltochelatase subunit CobN [Comamonas nitrativorans]|uniref:Cobaltochelatase subunit CobN n=1 Tax=Comamonas nitrativorans TaxID=108437 RepID=A0ABV9GXL8_9BURK